MQPGSELLPFFAAEFLGSFVVDEQQAGGEAGSFRDGGGIAGPRGGWGFRKENFAGGVAGGDDLAVGAKRQGLDGAAVTNGRSDLQFRGRFPKTTPGCPCYRSVPACHRDCMPTGERRRRDSLELKRDL